MHWMGCKSDHKALLADAASSTDTFWSPQKQITQRSTSLVVFNDSSGRLGNCMLTFALKADACSLLL